MSDLIRAEGETQNPGILSATGEQLVGKACSSVGPVRVPWEGSEDVCAREGPDKLSTPCWLTPEGEKRTGEKQEALAERKKSDKSGRPPDFLKIFP